MRKIALLFMMFVLSAALIISCSNNTTTTKQEATSSSRGLSVQNIDSAIKPGDNFYLYANGKWYDTATILPTESRAGARLEMDNIARTHIKGILEDAAGANNTAGSIEQKVGDLYASGMDTNTIEKLGYDPIKPFLREADSINDIKGLLAFTAKQETMGNQLFISPAVVPDDKNSSRYMVAFYQGGIGLPDRDYYFKNDSATQRVVKAYQKYIYTLFTLTGDDSAKAMKNMQLVYELEKQMAASHRTNVELRDPQANYNKMALGDIDKKMPVIGWKQLLTNLKIKTDSVNIGQPSYYTALDKLLKTVPIETWKTYTRFHVIDNAADGLSSPFVNASFEYSGKTLSGQKQLKERWERMYHIEDGTIGEALGQLYVKKYFTEDAKKRIQELVNNLQAAFEIRIKKLDWMSDSTKQKAIAKLHTFTKKVGFPDKWRDYSKVTISRNDFFGNLISCNKNQYEYMLSKVGQPVDRAEWGMTPPTNNAYYNPTFNEIVFPAGILQFPMFDVNSDDALNYGGIGMVIGHEMTHAFDDQGAQYDLDGNLKNWWSKEDYDKFKAKGQQVINLYNGFTVFDTVHVNGRLTQGENTADIGGIAIAYDAFKMTKQGKDTTRIQGFTPDQRFFLSFAQNWRKKIKDEAMMKQINTDPHSPALYRVWGPLMNFAPFYAAFNIKEGDKMYVPEKDRIGIW